MKQVTGSTVKLICELKEGDLVELGPVMGKGFPIERIEGPEAMILFLYSLLVQVSGIILSLAFTISHFQQCLF